MKYTLEELRELNPSLATETKLQQIEEDLRSMSAKREQIQAKLKQAAHDEDMAAMKELQIESNSIDLVIAAKQLEHDDLKNIPPDYDKQDIKTSWAAIAADYNKSFSAKKKAFLAARKALSEKYLELAEMQRQIICDAVHVNTLVNGYRAETLPAVDAELPSLETLESFTADFAEKTPDQIIGNVVIRGHHIKYDLWLKAFLASGEITRETAARLSPVIVDQKPTK